LNHCFQPHRQRRRGSDVEAIFELRRKGTDIHPVALVGCKAPGKGLKDRIEASQEDLKHLLLLSGHEGLGHEEVFFIKTNEI